MNTEGGEVEKLYFVRSILKQKVDDLIYYKIERK